MTLKSTNQSGEEILELPWMPKVDKAYSTICCMLSKVKAFASTLLETKREEVLPKEALMI